MQLNKKAFGLSLGILCGLCVFACTVWIMFKASGGDHLYLMRQFYPGYNVSWPGAFLGLVYGFVDGFVGGWVFAWLYNKFLGK